MGRTIFPSCGSRGRLSRLAAKLHRCGTPVAPSEAAARVREVPRAEKNRRSSRRWSSGAKLPARERLRAARPGWSDFAAVEFRVAVGRCGWPVGLACRLPARREWFVAWPPACTALSNNRLALPLLARVLPLVVPFTVVPEHSQGIRGIGLREGAIVPGICWRSSVGRASDL